MAARYYHSLRFAGEKCEACMACMRACPTAALRIRDSRAVMLQDRCIDCGECLRVCAQGGVVPLTDTMAELGKFERTVAVPSPALYAQFEPEVSTGLILEALRGCGFDEVISVSSGCDAATAATELFLEENHGQPPVISSFCPTVVRLVQVKYPDLVDQLLPVVAPRELSAEAAKVAAARRFGVPSERVGAVYITPCPAKMVAIADHPGMEASNLDAAVSISDLFHLLAPAIARGQEEGMQSAEVETASAMSWAFFGGSAGLLPAENSLSVAGLPNVIRILDDIEKGRLRRYAYIECHACPEGCVSGCMTVENPYVARARAIHRMQLLPPGPAVRRDEVAERYEHGGLRLPAPISARPLRPLDDDIGKAIAKMKEKERINASLPGIDCGACGSPTCRAFAEDVALGEAAARACVFFRQRELVERIGELAALAGRHRLSGGSES